MYLDIESAHRHLIAMGFEKITLRQVRRWASKRCLPFFIFQKNLYIDQLALEDAFRRMQAGAATASDQQGVLK